MTEVRLSSEAEVLHLRLTHRHPLSAKHIARLQGRSARTVQQWATEHGWRSIRIGNEDHFLFDDVAASLGWESTPGRTH